MGAVSGAGKTSHVGPVELDPPYDFEEYGSTAWRAPRRELLRLPLGPTETHGPIFGTRDVSERDADLTRGSAGEPVGERIIVTGTLQDSAGRPLGGQLVEIWQANAAGRYFHDVDRHRAPLDPNFTGAGRCLTDGAGTYRFLTIRPGEYPWNNHPNAWRPAHIHFSVFGRAFTSRLVTQMYFPGDPLLDGDPMYRSVRHTAAARRLVALFDLDVAEEGWALGYRFDVVVGGTTGTPVEEPG